MHTIKLKVEDIVYEHIMFLLDSFKSKGIVIEEDKVEDGIDFSKYKINSFKNIKDPVKWQNEIRKEWDYE
jgi:hypothetical protein